MTMNISPRDWEALSALLDDQLNPNERARLERNLKDRADLRTALEELRQTRALLRSAPRLRAPRNFMLKAEMVGLRKPASSISRWLPAMRLTSAVASLMLIVVLLGDFLLAGRQAGSMMAAQPQDVSVLREAPPAMEAANQEIPPQAAGKLAPEASPEAQALQAAAPAAGVVTETPQPLAAAALADQSAYPPPAEEPAASELQIKSGSMPLAGETITSTGEANLAMAPPLENAYPLEEPSAKAAPEAMAEIAPESVEGTVDDTSLQEQPIAAVPVQPFWTAWRIAEVLLAVTALAAGLAALALWRRSLP